MGMTDKSVKMLIVLLFAAGTSWGAARTQISVTAAGSRIIPHENNYTFTVPGRVTTELLRYRIVDVFQCDLFQRCCSSYRYSN
jgi:hypothetical protein